jgi:uncharacterized protein (UPF0332 family)
VISLLQRHFVRTGLFPVSVAQAFPRAFEKRQKTGYADFATIELDEARSVRAEVQAFMEECGRLLDRLAAEEA